MKAVILNLALLAASTSAWSVIYHTDSDCRGDVVAHTNLKTATLPDSVCHAPGADPAIDSSAVVRSARIQGLEDDFDDVRDGPGARVQRTVRFYSNDDCFNNCTHRYVLGQRDWSDCVSFHGRYFRSKDRQMDTKPIPLKDVSFNVVEVGRLGSLMDGHSREDSSVLSDGFCMLSHGSKLTIHGKEYRMQQVAASWFHDIPVEDWNPAVHTKSTENRFAQHGDIDVFGEGKLWQEYAGYTRSVPLEQWNDTIHVMANPSQEANEDLMWSLQRYCKDVKLDNADAVEDMVLKVPSFDVAKICEEVARKMKEIEDEELRLMEEELNAPFSFTDQS